LNSECIARASANRGAGTSGAGRGRARPHTAVDTGEKATERDAQGALRADLGRKHLLGRQALRYDKAPHDA